MKKLEEVEVLIEDLDVDNITSILKKWREIVEVRRGLDALEEMLKKKVKAYLKERRWDRYLDKETNISVGIQMQKREIIDKTQVKLMLTPTQYAQVIKVTKFERMNIITPEMRLKMRRLVRKDKKPQRGTKNVWKEADKG